jgi:hypothetical protein
MAMNLKTAAQDCGASIDSSELAAAMPPGRLGDEHALYFGELHLIFCVQEIPPSDAVIVVTKERVITRWSPPPHRNAMIELRMISDHGRRL